MNDVGAIVAVFHIDGSVTIVPRKRRNLIKSESDKLLLPILERTSVANLGT
jgi:hypothetical protein